MKLTKKISAILLAMLVALSMTVTAFAAGDYSITINNDVDKHTYEAYQIFTGDLHDGVLSNIVWGTGVTEEGKTALGDASAKAEALTDDNAVAFAKEVAKYLTDVCASTNTKTDGEYVISGLTAGYYLVKDQDNSLAGADDAYTSYILKVVGNVTANPKSGKPTFEKKVKDINDSTETTKTDWQDSADYDIGDMVDFQLKGTVASNYDSYETYYFAFHDKDSAGLTFDPSSVKVYVDGTLITGNYEVVTDVEDDCTFEVVFSDLKDIAEVKANSEITVEYQSELNEDAVLGSTGNPNECYLEYSNNPNFDQSGDGEGGDGGEGDEDKPETGKTPEDKVIVFTYKTVVNKVDANGNPLTGAEFTLEKYNETTKVWDTVAVVVNDEGTVFTFNGIDDGKYRLTETDTPEGYNSIDPIYFEVTAEHDVKSDNPALTSLAATQTKADGTNLTSGVIAVFSADLTAGSLSTDIVNNTGSTLPSTGGMGTVAIYVLGAVLVLGGAICFIVKKRMGYEA